MFTIKGIHSTTVQHKDHYMQNRTFEIRHRKYTVINHFKTEVKISYAVYHMDLLQPFLLYQVRKAICQNFNLSFIRLMLNGVKSKTFDLPPPLGIPTQKLGMVLSTQRSPSDVKSTCITSDVLTCVHE